MTSKVKQRIVLIIALLSYFLTALSTSIVITGLTKISADLHLDQLGLSWVQNAYGLAFGSFILLSGRLSDLLGRRRVLNMALVIFSIGSLIAGFTDQTVVMIAARFLQGIGAAILAPTSMALLMDYFEGPALVRAIAWYSSISGLGASVGLVLGGVLASYLSWRIGFYLNVPVALVMLCLSVVTLKKSRVRHESFDWIGTVLSVIGSGILVYAVNGAKNGVLFLIIALILLSTFVGYEKKNQAPIMPLSIFHSRQRVLAYSIRALFVGAMMGFWFFISEYLQEVLHATPLLTGFAFLPMTLTLFITAILVPRLIMNWDNKHTLILANVLLVIGFLWIWIGGNHGYLTTVIMPMILFGIGQGLGLTPLTNFGIADVPTAQTGVASGMVNTAHQLGSVLGLAIMVNISSALVNAQNIAGQFRIAMFVGLILTIVCTGLSLMIHVEKK
ncbi:MFS transporter [Secundilactobacillus paracollinoides]|uniref:MFS transporter n=1 Tax=Secundilactobacillus paracollinoides TaxID=240427 RepID=A0A1B2J0V7_9LACO|nr:MFS transporter [Secundilactobacillus paracollinoides]ANZ61934.1 MFS transporter [Secundilactobacillus paracollinoides]ANZ63620.1 MFS transporter [Secundilactobacillus paracollinoides]ANZ67880.1 MFS transporter [Secundilactobacillus paracollinoides]